MKLLGALLSRPELEQMLGVDFCFELRGQLIEKSGYDFRNRLCHGFVSDGELCSAAAVNVWWLVLRLCLNPLYRAWNASKNTDQPEGGKSHKARTKRPRPDYKARVRATKARYARAYAKWTAKEEGVLVSMHTQGESLAKMSARLQRQPTAIRSRIAQLGLSERWET